MILRPTPGDVSELRSQAVALIEGATRLIRLIDAQQAFTPEVWLGHGLWLRDAADHLAAMLTDVLNDRDATLRDTEIAASIHPSDSSAAEPLADDIW